MIDVEWFPFDEQICQLKFGSWSYDEKSLDLRHLDGNVEHILEPIEKDGRQLEQNVSLLKWGIDLNDYYTSSEWEILAIPAKRHQVTYPSCCPGSNAYIDITYYLNLRRKPLFYAVNLVFPCGAIAFLAVLVFYLPSESCSKINLCISILVSLTIFVLLLTEIVPSTSIVLPLIGKFLLFTMLMVALSIFCTVITINIHYRSPGTHHMPKWVRRLFLDILPILLLMRRPKREKHRASIIEAIVRAEQSDLWRRLGLQKDPIVGNKPRGHFAKVNQYMPISLNYHGDPFDEYREMKRYNENALEKLMLKACANIRFIAHQVHTREWEDKIDKDWKIVAMVIDRLLLWIFSITSFVGSASILLQAPTFVDNRQAIDEAFKGRTFIQMQNYTPSDFDYTRFTT